MRRLSRNWMANGLMGVALVAAASACAGGDSSGAEVRLVTATAGPAMPTSTRIPTITLEPTVTPSPALAGADIAAAVEAAAQLLGADAEGACRDGRDCVRRPPGEQPSASRGLAQVQFASGQGGGAVLLMGRQADGGWGLWMAVQDEGRLVLELPAPARACGQGEFVAIYAEADAASAIVMRVAREQVVRAESFRLTEGGSLAKEGLGWYETTAPADGWVAASDLASGTACPAGDGEGDSVG
jgi:hypothetical protein